MEPLSNDCEKKDTAVKVAIRLRPLIPKEISEGCGDCLDVYDERQVSVRGSIKSFTFDYCFGINASQNYIYETTVSSLIEKLFAGYNVTILAYGQTGSGKTYSMGTTYSSHKDSFSEAGIIPRAISDIFKSIEDKTDEEIVVKASFIELYNEALFDLICHKPRDEAMVDIREDSQGGIKVCGLTEIPVHSLSDALRCLEEGAQNRVTGSTAMNSRSSRSHAIFSLHLELGKNSGSDRMTAKFHLVDLAGSERAKKTKATGERFKEGVNINKGLLALGNVISALCVEGPRGFVPYRDSKLTRLLQDSLGGNSYCLMLACVSPADSNLEETLSTLRYADRAKKIKNKPIVNRDPHAAEVANLRQQVQELQLQIIAFRNGLTSSVGDSACVIEEVNKLTERIKELEEENEKLTKALHSALDENTNMAEKAIMTEMAREQLKRQLEELTAQTGNTVNVLNQSLDVASNPKFVEQLVLIKDLQKKIHELQDDQSKREKAIKDHELSHHSMAANSIVTFPSDDHEISGDNENRVAFEESPIKGDFGTTFTLKQAKLNEELTALNRALAMKEELVTKMTTSDSQLQTLRTTYEKNLKDLEDQISFLQKEKETLLSRVRESNAHSASSKIAEQRRKRLQELETQITNLKRKVMEQSKLLKIKEQSEKKVTQLSSEIQLMKTTRVKLIRQLKEDNEKFRKWKAQKDREVEKLKVADRKKQVQIVKMERLHSKQQNVLKRKMEEATAINKRLKDAIALQKVCQQKRIASKDIDNVNNRVKCWLDGEVEVVVMKKLAKNSLEPLKEDRKNISEQLAKIKKQIENNEVGPEFLEGLKKTKDNLEKDLQLRTAQISDIQTKILDEEEEASCIKKTIDSVSTMVEAKSGMLHLFRELTKSQTKVLTMESELNYLNSNSEEANQHIQELESNLTKLKADHEKELTKISRDHEERVLFILRQMPSTQEVKSDTSVEKSDLNAELVERLKFQEEELGRLSHLHDLLQNQIAENEALKSQVQELQAKSSVASQLTPKVINLDNDKQVEAISDEEVYPKPRQQKKKRSRPSSTAKSYTTSYDIESSFDEGEQSGEEEMQKVNDPDWEKTPLFKRIRQIVNRGGRRAGDCNIASSSTQNPLVSSSDSQCKCGKDCSTRLCKCKKSGAHCSVTCRCNAMLCKNRSSIHTVDDLSSAEVSKVDDTFLNSTFEITNHAPNMEPLAENVNTSKRRKLSGNGKFSSSVSGGYSSSDTENINPKPAEIYSS